MLLLINNHVMIHSINVLNVYAVVRAKSGHAHINFTIVFIQLTFYNIGQSQHEVVLTRL